MGLTTEAIPADVWREMVGDVSPMPRMELSFPMAGERFAWYDRIWLDPEPFDDGGGAALAAYKFGHCR